MLCLDVYKINSRYFSHQSEISLNSLSLEDSAATLSHDFFHTSRRLSLTQLLHNQSSLTPGSLFQRANAKLVYACEWNPNAIEALQHNLQANSVSDFCIVLEGDNRITAPKGVADRVCLGLIATSEGSWVTAVRALRTLDLDVFHLLDEIGIDSRLRMRAYLYLIKNPNMLRAFIGYPVEERKELLFTMMSDP